VKLIRIDEGDEIAAVTKLDVHEEAEVIEELAEGTETTNLPENPSEGENPVQS
jgi:hypothetical protein